MTAGRNTLHHHQMIVIIDVNVAPLHDHHHQMIIIIDGNCVLFHDHHHHIMIVIIDVSVGVGD